MQSSSTLTALFGVVASYIIFWFTSSLIKSYRIAASVKKLGCEYPPRQQDSSLFGISTIRTVLKKVAEQQFPPYLIERHESVGGALTYMYSLLGATIYSTTDEKNIQTMLATNFRDYSFGTIRPGNFGALLGSGIFTQDGKVWEHSRAMLRPQFARDQISDLDLEEAHVQNLMKSFDAHRAVSGPTGFVDLQPLFFRLTLDSATEFLFGKPTESQIGLMPGNNLHAGNDGVDFAANFDAALMGLKIRLTFVDFWWMYNPKWFQKACKESHKYIDAIVRTALAKSSTEKKQTNAAGKEKYVFLDALILETQDPIELRSQCLNILLAGRDTTASHLGWLFFSLSKDPARYKKLRGIVLDSFGTYEHPRGITFETLKSCQYLQHCNNEALRMYPAVPINGRTAIRDTILPRGGGKDGKSPIFIPKGTNVDYSVHAMHYRKDVWGQDAFEFNPERWEGRKAGWDFLPFNGGPRVCIGQQFALTEAGYVTVRLLQRFESMENMDEDDIIRHNLSLTNSSGNGVKVKVHLAAK